MACWLGSGIGCVVESQHQDSDGRKGYMLTSGF